MTTRATTDTETSTTTSATGTTDQVVERIGKLGEIGVTDFAAVEFPGNPDEAEATRKIDPSIPYGFLRKPYERKELGEKLRELLVAPLALKRCARRRGRE